MVVINAPFTGHAGDPSFESVRLLSWERWCRLLKTWDQCVRDKAQRDVDRGDEFNDFDDPERLEARVRKLVATNPSFTPLPRSTGFTTHAVRCHYAP